MYFSMLLQEGAKLCYKKENNYLHYLFLAYSNNESASTTTKKMKEKCEVEFRHGVDIKIKLLL